MNKRERRDELLLCSFYDESFSMQRHIMKDYYGGIVDVKEAKRWMRTMIRTQKIIKKVYERDVVRREE